MRFKSFHEYSAAPDAASAASGLVDAVRGRVDRRMPADFVREVLWGLAGLGDDEVLAGLSEIRRAGETDAAGGV